MDYHTSSQSTPLLIFDGNCQAHELAAIFAGSGLAETYCVGEDYGFVPSFQGFCTIFTSVKEITTIAKTYKSLGRKVYQVSQSTQILEAPNHHYTTFVDAVVKFPYLQFYTVEPGAFERVFGRKISPQRLLDFDLKLMQVCQSKAGSSFDFASFVSQASVARMLFNTSSHPRGPLVAKLFLEIAKQIPEIISAEAHALSQLLEDCEGINHVTCYPLPEEWISALGYDWGLPYEFLCKVLRLARTGEWQSIVDLIGCHEDLIDDSQILFAACRSVICLGSDECHSGLFHRLTELTPGVSHSWSLRNEYYRSRNMRTGMANCLADMRRALRRSRMYSQSRAWIEIQNGDAAEALSFAFDYLQRTPDRADGITAYVKALGLLGRVDEARSVFYDFAARRGTADFKFLVEQLPALEELKIDPSDLRSRLQI